ncbi:hypothetical protein niasHS_002214 [Heterodera schachtii]|uniref:Uncharacterized protein n=1 Tax=Heterodera schachtii TaxID=97005 RepID=A0ABD2KN89_HETSC
MRWTNRRKGRSMEEVEEERDEQPAAAKVGEEKEGRGKRKLNKGGKRKGKRMVGMMMNMRKTNGQTTTIGDGRFVGKQSQSEAAKQTNALPPPPPISPAFYYARVQIAEGAETHFPFRRWELTTDTARILPRPFVRMCQ